jgi:hypothetical protein
LADRGTGKALLIRSDGGNVSVGMDFGDWVYERGINVMVDDAGFSSCANERRLLYCNACAPDRAKSWLGSFASYPDLAG